MVKGRHSSKVGILFPFIKLLYFIFLLSGVKLRASAFHPSWRASGRPPFLIDTLGERKSEIMQSNREKEERLSRERKKWLIIAAPTGKLPIFVLKASQNSICREVCLAVCQHPMQRSEMAAKSFSENLWLLRKWKSVILPEHALKGNGDKLVIEFLSTLEFATSWLDIRQDSWVLCMRKKSKKGTQYSR